MALEYYELQIVEDNQYYSNDCNYNNNNKQLHIIDKTNEKMCKLFNEYLEEQKQAIYNNGRTGGNSGHREYLQVNIGKITLENEAYKEDKKFGKMIFLNSVLCFLEYDEQNIANILFIDWLVEQLKEIWFLSFSLKFLKNSQDINIIPMTEIPLGLGIRCAAPTEELGGTHIPKVVQYYFSDSTQPLPPNLQIYYDLYKPIEDKLLMHYINKSNSLIYSNREQLTWTPSHITHLELCYMVYNYPLENLPTGLIYLHLKHLGISDCGFNQPLDNLPSGLKYLILSQLKYNHPLDNLPPGLEYLAIDTLVDFSQPFNNLPQSLKYLSINHISRSYEYSITELPDSIEHLYLDISYEYKYNENVKIPKNTKFIHYPYMGLHNYNIPNHITKINNIPIRPYFDI